MADIRTDTIPTLPVANYSPAIARAVDWLGDRYLLANPINAPRPRRSPVAPASRAAPAPRVAPATRVAPAPRVAPSAADAGRPDPRQNLSEGLSGLPARPSR